MLVIQKQWAVFFCSDSGVSRSGSRQKIRDFWNCRNLLEAIKRKLFISCDFARICMWIYILEDMIATSANKHKKILFAVVTVISVISVFFIKFVWFELFVPIALFSPLRYCSSAFCSVGKCNLRRCMWSKSQYFLFLVGTARI